MRQTIWNKHIPTLLGISIIIIGIAIANLLVKSGVVIIGQAKPAAVPKEIKVVNISDTSFTVTHLTEETVIGSVNFGKDRNLNQVAFDERDENLKSITPRKIHSIKIKNLAPSTKYFFSITSGDKIFLNGTVPFEISTASTLTSQSLSQKSLKGRVILNGEKVNEAIVYATAENGQVLSTMVKDGSYELPLKNMRTSQLSSYFNFKEDTIIKIAIENDTLKSNVSISPYQETIPTVILSYDYDFTTTTPPVSSKLKEPIGFPPIPFNKESVLGVKTGIPQIILPKKDQEFIDQQPEFRGTAVPRGTVRITIRSPQNIEVQILADSFGNWKYRPSTPLPPGRHTIIIATRNASGILKTISQSFIIHAQGTQVSKSATPSATPTFAFPKRTPTPTPIRTSTPTPTPTPIKIGQAPTLTPTPTRTPAPIPTPTLCPGCPTPTPTPILIVQNLTLTPTLCPGCPNPTPTPTGIAGLTPTPTIAPPGDSSLTTIGILGAIVAVIGGLLFLLTRSGI